MTADPSSPMANPGRRRLVEDLTAERFGASSWFRTIPPQVEDPQMQALRQLEINEAVEDDEEEDADGGIEAPAL